MPYRPKKLCRCKKVNCKGCHNTHTTRDSRLKRIDYGDDWQKIREKVLSEFPICQECNTEVSNVVHHLDGVKKGHKNLQALCERCHNRITGKEKGWKNLNNMGEL